MTEADELKHLLSELAVDLFNATGDGSAATQRSNDALIALAVFTTAITDARAHAYQELGNLQDAHAKAQRVFNKSLTAESAEIISQVEQAKERVNTYANRMRNRIDEADKLTNLLNHWIDTEMSASGNNIRIASDKLTELYNRY